MKVLFDPIYTQELSKCASTYKFKAAAEFLLNTYPDAYIYWRVPALTSGDLDWLIS